MMEITFPPGQVISVCMYRGESQEEAWFHRFCLSSYKYKNRPFLVDTKNYIKIEEVSCVTEVDPLTEKTIFIVKVKGTTL